MVDSLLDLRAGTQWILQDEGRLRLRKAVVRAGKPELPEAMIFALALTEKGVELGLGQVFYLQPHPRSDNNGTLPAFSFFDAFLEIKSVPQLIYVPKRWSSAQQNTWGKLTPAQQLYQLDARHGWIPDFAAVLPIIVEHQEQRPQQPIFDGYSTAPVTVYLSSRCLVAPTSDLRALCDRSWQAATSKQEARNQQPKSTFFTAKSESWEAFERWGLDGVAGVMSELESICRASAVQASYIQLFGHLRLQSIDAANRAHIHGQDYACRGTKSDWKVGRSTE